jgi:hypothetical protein
MQMVIAKRQQQRKRSGDPSLNSAFVLEPAGTDTQTYMTSQYRYLYGMIKKLPQKMLHPVLL